MASMSPRLAIAIAAAALASQGVGAAPDIVRCKDSRGGVTYQAAPCPDKTDESRPGILSEYPAPNTAERDRLLAREAALDRRLESARDRWQHDAALRAAREERELERERLAVLAAAQQQQYAVVYPLWGAHHARRVARPAPRHSGQAIFR